MPLEMVIRLSAELTGIVSTWLKPLRQRGYFFANVVPRLLETIQSS